eukprot:m.129921 g.129921  ORF g.129921 m.129921 type:complete len:130 (-) comp13895_c0_seq15:1926-2315(-)
MGNIDASFFLDQATNTSYLIWKRDGNGHFPPVPTPIFIQPLSRDGLTREGNQSQMITNDQRWEGPLVEGPWLIFSEVESMYYLFFSANGFTSPKYAIGVARSVTVVGPYTKVSHRRGVNIRTCSCYFYS